MSGLKHKLVFELRGRMTILKDTTRYTRGERIDQYGIATEQSPQNLVVSITKYNESTMVRFFWSDDMSLIVRVTKIDDLLKNRKDDGYTLISEGRIFHDECLRMEPTFEILTEDLEHLLKSQGLMDMP